MQDQNSLPSEEPHPIIPNSDQRQPLSYESLSDHSQRKPRRGVLAFTFETGLGFVFSAGFILVASGFLFFAVNPLDGKPDSEGRLFDGIIAASYAVATTAAIFKIQHLYRNWRITGVMRFFFLGGLIAGGIALLIEGICFSLKVLS